ncbi:MAG: M6 family metalloprotease domain-containing protein [Candidatus Eisenbacteria bacterium]|nr:M6 family metalloprotease domain-containing protein [Candidatus Eisenbacteria bacterium]
MSRERLMLGGRPWPRKLCALVLMVFAALAGLASSSVCMPIRPDLLDRLEKEGRLGDFVEAQLPVENDAYERGLNVPSSRSPFPNGTLPINGTSTLNLRAVVILVDFEDNPADTVNYPPSYYDRLLFSIGERPTGSLREYFLENSDGKLNVTGAATRWLRMPHPYSYYVAGKRGIGTYPYNAQKLTEDAVVAADWEVNFSNFDNDGPDGVPDSGDDDGYVDALFIVHAGPGYETTLDTTNIHSHTWVVLFEQIVDGIMVWPYTMLAEDSRTGVFCHEFAHILGIPDLYDRDYSSRGLGSWSLMAFGGWNGLGMRPGHLDAWSKIKAGFTTPVIPATNIEEASFPPVERESAIYKLWNGGTGDREYFLLERREKIGFDEYLPGHGLLIYHVDEDVGSNDNAFRYKVALEQADGLWHLENNANLGDDGDPYPGSLLKSIFGYETTPGSLGYGGVDSRVRVFDIAQAESLLTAGIWVEMGPEVSVSSFVVKDSLGNNDGNPDPGETVSLKLYLKNSGSDATGVTGILVPRSSCVTMGSSSAAFGTIHPNSERWSYPPFTFTVSDTLSADPFGAWFDISVWSDSGFFTQDSILVGVGNVFGFKDDMEHPVGWVHYAARVGWHDEWHLSADRAFDGVYSWACANADSGVYSPRTDAALVTPVMLVGSEPRLRFYHWIDASVDADGALAGGFVEISSNGSPWTRLVPIGGYPYELKAIEEFPYADRGVFSGNEAQWERAEFNLSSYINSAIQLRFRFLSSSDSTVARGWYIDSLAVVTTSTPIWISSLVASEVAGCVLLSWNADSELRSLPFSVWRSPGPDGTEGMCKISSEPVFAGDYYDFRDCDVDPGVEYKYWVGVEGSSSLVYGPVMIQTSTRGSGSARLELVSTNPVTDRLKLRAWTPGGSAGDHISIRLFDTAGRFVRNLYDGPGASGAAGSEPISLEWDTKDYSGKHVGSGVYFLRLEWPTGAVVRKVLVLRASGGY